MRSDNRRLREALPDAISQILEKSDENDEMRATASILVSYSQNDSKRGF